MNPRGNRVGVEVARRGDDRRDAGADVVAADYRALADAHALHVGDGVQRTGFENADDDAGFPRPRSLAQILGGRLREQRQAAQKRENPRYLQSMESK